MTSPLGFKARVGSALFAIFAEANVMYIRQDPPGATLADLLAYSSRSRHFFFFGERVGGGAGKTFHGRLL